MQEKKEIRYYDKDEIDVSAYVVCENYYLRVYGTIPCGKRNDPDDNLSGYLKIPVSWLGDGDFYVLRAKGDSMINAGIDDGDLVIIRKQRYADDNQIAVVFVDGETTLKRIHLNPADNTVILQPANDAYEPVVVSMCEILGVAVQIIKDI